MIATVMQIADLSSKLDFAGHRCEDLEALAEQLQIQVLELTSRLEGLAASVAAEAPVAPPAGPPQQQPPLDLPEPANQQILPDNLLPQPRQLAAFNSSWPGTVPISPSRPPSSPSRQACQVRVDGGSVGPPDPSPDPVSRPPDHVQGLGSMTEVTFVPETFLPVGLEDCWPLLLPAAAEAALGPDVVQLNLLPPVSNLSSTANPLSLRALKIPSDLEGLQAPGGCSIRQDPRETSSTPTHWPTLGVETVSVQLENQGRGAGGEDKGCGGAVGGAEESCCEDEGSRGAGGGTEEAYVGSTQPVSDLTQPSPMMSPPLTSSAMALLPPPGLMPSATPSAPAIPLYHRTAAALPISVMESPDGPGIQAAAT